ncbi:hypothetical protein HOE37_04955 [Candidatus Woesearchaeota archaeon]|jgi:hypothetical protein|nr:hypothetical protein [Candidatus Woesearchaeota archaeon]MBT4111181.1 hypothetical protein [Candidatus Woesearchaeota archaeon]MBT4336762.1 hypothetical protein [Candidatus Woesearchaeota archaeon]MBT4469430.1 hypothetical protein [Candidatus Woesearchaeota archaeon]MBT6744175.1 hypothetical protein [Candidatus Woesearchaeota archaeon]
MMNKKAAIGLSINTLVVVIISLVVLAGGITLLYKFIGGAEEIKGELDAKTKTELERLLVDQGKPVALPLHVAYVNRGEQHVFGIGILNIGGVGDKFNIEVGLSKVLDETESQVSVSGTDTWLLFNTKSIKILEGEHVSESILVNVPKTAPNGQYIFSVKIFSDSKQYGNTQKFYVNVK